MIIIIIILIQICRSSPSYAFSKKAVLESYLKGKGNCVGASF